MGIDYVRLDPVLPPPFPLDVGMDDNAQPGGVGGGPNTTFVQESGTNPLPGNPASTERDTFNDDDYYFAGIYTNVIPEVVQFYEVWNTNRPARSWLTSMPRNAPLPAPTMRSAITSICPPP